MYLRNWGSTVQGPTRETLVKEAFKYQGILEAYAYGMLRDWALAQDAFQETILVLMDKWQAYDPRFKVSTWARQIIHHKCLELLRKRRRDVLTDNEQLLSLVHESLAERVTASGAERVARTDRALAVCVKELDDTARRILHEYYWQKTPCARIAKTLKRSVQSVWHSLSRLRAALRECVARKLGEEGLSP